MKDIEELKNRIAEALGDNLLNVKFKKLICDLANLLDLRDGTIKIKKNVKKT